MGRAVLSIPRGWAVGPDGSLYVAGYQINPASTNGAIYKFNANTGAYEGTFVTGSSLAEPQGIAFGPNGDLYVSNNNPNSDLAPVHRRLRLQRASGHSAGDVWNRAVTTASLTRIARRRDGFWPERRPLYPRPDQRRSRRISLQRHVRSDLWSGITSLPSIPEPGGRSRRISRLGRRAIYSSPTTTGSVSSISRT